MTRAIAVLGVLAAAVAAVTLSTTASASPAAKAGATWTVWAGPSGFAKHVDAPQYAEATQFFPSTLTINAGDSVTFRTMEGHTVTFLGNKKASDFGYVNRAPKGATYASVNGADGKPFWFAGKAKYVYTVMPLMAPAGTTTITAGTFHNRAIFGPGPGNPPGSKSFVTYTFPKAGVYHYVCLMHLPAMKGTIIVKPAGAAGPSVGKAQADATTQLAHDIALAKQLDTYKAPANTIVAGRSRSGIDLMRFYPQRLSVKAGTTVKIVSGSAVEVHSLLFAPKDAWTKAYLKTSDQFPMGQIAPEEIYGTDAPGTPYTGKNHGNGFFSTPIVTRGALPAGITGHRTASITFTNPGTYKYFCEIHGKMMSGTVVVTP
jgi:plastocyanin